MALSDFVYMHKDIFIHNLFSFLIYKIIFLVILQSPDKGFSPDLRPLSPELGKRQENCKWNLNTLVLAHGLFRLCLQTYITELLYFLQSWTVHSTLMDQWKHPALLKMSVTAKKKSLSWEKKEPCHPYYFPVKIMRQKRQTWTIGTSKKQ